MKQDRVLKRWIANRYESGAKEKTPEDEVHLRLVFVRSD